MAKETQSAPVARIEGNNLVITLPLQTPTPSSSGKTKIVATTSGNVVTPVTIDGKPVWIGVNAWIK